MQCVEAAAGGNPATINQAVGYGYMLGNLSGISYPSGRQLGRNWVDGDVTGIALGGTALTTQIDGELTQTELERADGCWAAFSRPA